MQQLIYTVSLLLAGCCIGIPIGMNLRDRTTKHYEETIDALFTELCESNRQLYNLQKKEMAKNAGNRI